MGSCPECFLIISRALFHHPFSFVTISLYHHFNFLSLLFIILSLSSSFSFSLCLSLYQPLFLLHFFLVSTSLFNILFFNQSYSLTSCSIYHYLSSPFSLAFLLFLPLSTFLIIFPLSSFLYYACLSSVFLFLCHHFSVSFILTLPPTFFIIFLFKFHILNSLNFNSHLFSNKQSQIKHLQGWFYGKHLVKADCLSSKVHLIKRNIASNTYKTS